MRSVAVRALVAGVSDFPEPVTSEEEEANGSQQLGPLPSVKDAVRIVASALHRIGIRTDGDPLLEPNRDIFLHRWRLLRRGSDAGEPLIVHFAGHGIRGASGNL